ncbi:type IX secretion system sortase PorU [Spirosoma flavus]
MTRFANLGCTKKSVFFIVHHKRYCLSFVLTALIFSTTFLAAGQSVTNDPDPTRWINYAQSYYKIPTVKTGLYRITATELQKAGFPIGQVNPTSVQLFHRGVEQAIYVAGEADERFDPTDFLEFYARQNDGSQDSLLYRPTSAQPHTYYSLFSDTTAYFLTWRLDGKPGKRMTAYVDTTFANLLPEPYHWAEEIRVFTDTYPAGTIYPLGAGYNNGAILTNYDEGEGWTGPVVTANTRFSQSFSLPNFAAATYADGTPVQPKATYLLVGRNAGTHRVSCLAGGTATTLQLLDTALFDNYKSIRFDAELDVNVISPSGNVVLSVQPNVEGEEISVSYLKLHYPQHTDMGGLSQKEFRLRANPDGHSRLDLTNVVGTIRLYDISEPTTPIFIQGRQVDKKWQGVVRNSQMGRTILATQTPMNVPAIQAVTFRFLGSQNPNYIIITHPSLQQATSGEADPVRAYATYRASEEGGRFDTLTVSIQQLFDQYSYGERHPLAIRRFADFVLRNGDDKPKFLFLIGQSRDPQGIRKLPNGTLLDLIPNAGWPGSDIGLVEGLAGEQENVPALAIGRLNANRPQQVLDYLNKVKAHENTSEPALWRKNALHLSGGRSTQELGVFRKYIDEFTKTVETGYSGGRVITLSKQTDNPVETLSLAEPVNQGVGIINLFGHSSLDVADIDLGFASNDLLNYRNKGRYPFLLVNGCASGNVFFGRPTFGNDWILTPDRGAVLFLAHTYTGFVDPLKRYSEQLYALLADSQYVAQPIGLLQQETIRRFLQPNASIFDITTAQQMTLQGDPAIRIFPFQNPDVAFAPESLNLRVYRDDSSAIRSDSIRISGVVVNYGRVTYKSLTIRIRQFKNDGQLLQEQFFTQKTPHYADTLQWALPLAGAKSDTTNFELFLDPDNRITETLETNNQAIISTLTSVEKPLFAPDVTPPLLEVAFDGKQISNGDLVSPQPVIDVLLQDDNLRLLRTDTTGMDLYLQSPCATLPCPFIRQPFRENNVRWVDAGADNAFRLSYQPNIPLADGQYTLVVTGRDLSGNRAAPYQIHFTVKNTAELLEVGIYPNPFSDQTRFYATLSGFTPPIKLSIRITDLNGRLVRTLQTPNRIGINEWFWDGTSEMGAPLPTGLYLYTLTGVDIPFSTQLRLSGRVFLQR